MHSGFINLGNGARNMPIHPIEYRYSTGEMQNIFSYENRLDLMLKVEAALAIGHAAVGNIPKEAAETIKRNASLEIVSKERIQEIEHEIDHDIMAVVKALAEKCGDAGKYIHLGATSYDIVDTVLALQFKQGLEVIEKRLLELLKILLKRAENEKNTVCIGRTHGQHAIPTTYGMKFALWADEIARHIERISDMRKRVLVGKLSGAVGTMASFGEKGFEIREAMMKELGIKAARITNQVVQRDIHAEVIMFLALVSGTLYKIGKEIRNLQRTEIDEVYEPFTAKQVGSSTMSQKRNPHRAERVCGLSRVIQSNVIPALQDIALEHERDLTNSSVERVIIPENFVLLDYILKEMIDILDRLELNYESIKRNLNLTHGLIMSERIMIKLVEKGLSRQDAHEILRVAAIKVRREKISFIEALLENKKVAKHISRKELEELLNPETYIGTAVQQVEYIINELTPILEARLSE